MLDIAQGDLSQVSRTFKLLEKEFNFCEAQLIENYIRLIENRTKTDST